MKKLATLVLSLASIGSALAAAYDYEVEYVKSSRGSCVKTDFVPQPDMTFRLEVKFEGTFVQMFNFERFKEKVNTRTIFGCEEKEIDGGRDMYSLELGGNDQQAFQNFVNFGRRGNKGAGQCGQQEVNATCIDSRIEITYDGRHLRWGSFDNKLSDEKRVQSTLPVSFFGVTLPDGSVKSYACYDMSLFGAAFYKDGKQIATFVPVVKDGVAGLYDKVAKKFYASVTDAPLTAGPKVERKTDTAKKSGKVDMTIPIFEDDFTNEKVFAERWNFRGNAQKNIVIKDGAVRFPGMTGDGISWKGELPDEFIAEAVLVNYPEWSEKKYDPNEDEFRWSCMSTDYGNFGIRHDGNGVYLFKRPGQNNTCGAYPAVANYKSGEPVTVRFERRKLGEAMMGYTYYVNGVKLGYYTTQTPQKVVGFDGVARHNPLTVECFQCPFEVRRVSIWEIKGTDSPNVISNSGFEFDSDGVPPHYCNRSYFAAGDCTPDEYKKFLRSFIVDKTVKHSGKQSLRLSLGHFVRSLEFFSWNAPTEKGKSAVLSVWAKASEPGVKFKLKLSNESKVVDLTTEWKRYEVTTTDMPAPGIFSPVWFEVPEIYNRKNEATIWMDDIQLEFMEAPAGGFDPAKTYATEYKPKSGDAEVFALPKATPHPAVDRKVPLTAAENALNGCELPKEGLILGHYDFYMNEKTADFRIWNEKGELVEKAVDISKLAPGTHEVTVNAFGKDWKASVRKLAYKKGATQINQWSRSVVHDGKPTVMAAPCLIGRENAPKADGSSTQVDILLEAGIKYVNLQNHLSVGDIEGNAKLVKYGTEKGMKFMIWTGENDLKDVGDIRDNQNQLTDWSRQKMYDMLDSDNIVNWLVLDEPEYRKPEDCQAYMAREKARFPYKPVQMNNSWLGINGRFAGLPTDILMIDYYLTCEGTTVAMVVDKVDVLRSIVPGKPCWFFLASENSLHHRIPSYQEHIAQAWGSVAAGASGLSWFVNMPTAECTFNAIKDINHELADNVDFLCSDELCGGAITTETKDYIRCLTRKHGNEWRLFTANLNPHPNKKVGIVLPPEIPASAKVEVMYENRTIPLKFDEKRKVAYFIDAYAGFARHIYRIVK